jgi:hypothetical protein
MKNAAIAILVIIVILLGFKLFYPPHEAVAPVVDTSQTVMDLSTQTLPASCISKEEGTPVITSLSNYSMTSTGVFEVRGCNFSGFEGDKDVWIESPAGVKGYLYGAHGSSNERIELILTPKLCQQANTYTGNPCESYLDLVPGVYKLYTAPWGKKSNVVLFEIK